MNISEFIHVWVGVPLPCVIAEVQQLRDRLEDLAIEHAHLGRVVRIAATSCGFLDITRLIKHQHFHLDQPGDLLDVHLRKI